MEGGFFFSDFGIPFRMLITCSTPLIKTCYFLYTEEARGVRFGIWGWCLDEYGICSTPLQYVVDFLFLFTHVAIVM